MANAISRGYTFGATELVTNAKLHSLVDSATAVIDTVTATGAAGGTGSAGAGNQYIPVNIGGIVYKLLYDGTV